MLMVAISQRPTFKATAGHAGAWRGRRVREIPGRPPNGKSFPLLPGSRGETFAAWQSAFPHVGAKTFVLRASAAQRDSKPVLTLSSAPAADFDVVVEKTKSKRAAGKRQSRNALVKTPDRLDNVFS